MRVIAGSARGRKLLAPKGHGTRPTPDRVREAIFSILGGEIDGAVVLDLYSGTGAMGIEALSRGAAGATFVEHDAKAVRILRQNLDVVDTERSRLLETDVTTALSRLAGEDQTFDVIFMDPPYGRNQVAETVSAIAELDLLKGNGIVVCEHSSHERPPPTPSPWSLLSTRVWGDVSATLFRKGGPS